MKQAWTFDDKINNGVDAVLDVTFCFLTEGAVWIRGGALTIWAIRARTGEFED
jgi:hypothetical protein